MAIIDDSMELDAGKDAPEIVNAVIEIPMGSNVKYEFDKKANMIKVDRVLYTSMNYPFNYGFIPGTLEEDGDPDDILVITNMPFAPGTYMEVRPIGLIHMKDEEGEDTKILAVPKDKVDPSFAHIKEATDIPEITRKKIIHFFEHYKELEPNKWVKISGWGSAKEAKEKIIKSIKK